MAAAEGKEKADEVLLDNDKEIEHEVWGPISRNQTLLFTRILILKVLLSLDVEYRVQTRLCLESSVNHKEGNRTSFFVKLCIKVNTNRQKGPRTTMKELTYFGKVVSYLRYTFPDRSSKLLSLVNVFDVKTNKDSLWQYKTPSAVYKIKVVNADEIVSFLAVHLVYY
ncbi:hypothetical protein BCV71DRAFT_235709 [Rhizopus microsporus]|uniref:Uncharacterized protein n=1 Tax=Rhizopus microsporus TaxID=58291 RepID=A0A1X0S038_RHIZD|nr:hypothetical protein BCV71DRAFT_235709 [Rhizopus microsporus]